MTSPLPARPTPRLRFARRLLPLPMRPIVAGVAAGVVTAALMLASPRTSFATPASASNPSDLAAARLLFVQGEADEQAGHWADALVKIRRASTVKMTPGLRFHIALCEEKLGHLVAALDDYKAAQAAAQAVSNHEIMDLTAEALAPLKVRIPSVTVNIPARFQTDATRAEVRLDGTPMPPASVGTAVPVDAGSHMIQAVAPGQTPYAMTITVVERQAATIDIQFLPLGGVAPAAPVVVVAPASVAPPPRASGANAEPASHPSHTLAIVATAGAVVLVAGGIGAFAASGSEQSSSMTACTPFKLGCGNATAVRAWDALALGAWIAGAGAGVVAVVLWTKPNAFGGDSGHAELRAGPGTLMLGGSF